MGKRDNLCSVALILKTTIVNIDFRKKYLFYTGNSYRMNNNDSDCNREANNVDPDQTAPKEQSDQGLHCLQQISLTSPIKVNGFVQ